MARAPRGFKEKSRGFSRSPRGHRHSPRGTQHSPRRVRIWRTGKGVVPRPRKSPRVWGMTAELSKIWAHLPKKPDEETEVHDFDRLWPAGGEPRLLRYAGCNNHARL